MIEELTVRNFALIDELKVNFGAGFNVLSGETGAGKSILIDALSLVLGAKGDGASIREGADEAEVSAIFRVAPSPELNEWIEKYKIQPEDDTLMLRRTLRPNGRGSASIQAMPVTRAAMVELADAMVDIHGQHERQSLFNVAAHRKLLDRFAGIEDRVRAFSLLFSELSDIGRKLSELSKQEGQMTREADFLRYAAEEIRDTQLKPGEDGELEKRQKILSRYEELSAGLEQVLRLSSESRNGALARLRDAREQLMKAARIDSSLSEAIPRFDGAFIELEDVIEFVRHKMDAAEYDSGELARVDERLSIIATLNKKYACGTVDELIDYEQSASRRLEEFDNRDEERGKLIARHDQLQAELISEASAISAIRRQFSSSLQSKAESHLRALGMADARFTVKLAGKQNAEAKPVVGSYGIDVVEFLLSANRGESPKALKAVASGGELSRVMLAVKTVLSESDTVQTMIFDEVDAGIGGEVARSVGEHLHGLSTRKQVFCITHLASIAVFADNHVQVDKHTIDGRTITTVHHVEGEERVREIARMLAGDRDGVASQHHALRLLEERSGSGARSGKN